MTSNLDLFFQGYLVSVIFWIGIPLGSLLIIMMHNLTGGKWGEKLKPLLIDTTQGLLPMGLLFLPVCFWGLPHLYSWAAGLDSNLTHAKHIYLSQLYFSLRALIYFAVWILVRFFLLWSNKKERISSIGLIALFFTISFAAIDWIMSLESSWYSTIFGLLIIIGMAISSLTFTILKAAILKKSIEGKDLGNLLLAFVMVWAYFSFSQYLIMWMGNMPEETNWYLSRTHNGWGALAAILIGFQFFVPFIILLFRSAKNSAVILSGVAGLVLLMHGVDLYWIILPSVRTHLQFHFMDIVSFIGVGLFWLYFQRAPRKAVT